MFIVTEVEEHIPDAASTASDLFAFDKDFIVPPEERRECIKRVYKQPESKIDAQQQFLEKFLGKVQFEVIFAA